MTIDRRLFLKATGAVAVVGLLPAAPRTIAVELRAPGTYQISGQVRLEQPVVTISGISNAQQISWTPGSLSTPVANFTSFEHFDRAWSLPAVQVSGGTLQS